MVIDGAHGEGGGSIVRIGMGLALLDQRPITITDLRKNRDKPGLKTQHLVGARALAKLCNGTLQGDQLGSTEISFSPSSEIRSSLTADIKTAGSVGLFLQGLALGACSPRDHPIEVTITGGGTFGLWAPSTSYLEHITYPLLRRMGLKILITVERQGFYPKGGARTRVQIESSHLPLIPIDLTEMGKIEGVAGVITVSQELQKPRVGERIQKSVEGRILAKIGQVPIEIDVIYCQSSSVGVGVDLWANTTTGARPCAGTFLGKKGVSSEEVGRKTADALCALLQNSIPVDEYLADQLIPYAALAEGESHLRAPVLSMHAETNLWLLHQFFPDLSWDIARNTRGVEINIRGIGFRG